MLVGKEFLCKCVTQKWNDAEQKRVRKTNELSSALECLVVANGRKTGGTVCRENEIHFSFLVDRVPVHCKANFSVLENGGSQSASICIYLQQNLDRFGGRRR